MGEIGQWVELYSALYLDLAFTQVWLLMEAYSSQNTLMQLGRQSNSIWSWDVR